MRHNQIEDGQGSGKHFGANREGQRGKIKEEREAEGSSLGDNSASLRMVLQSVELSVILGAS